MRDFWYNAEETVKPPLGIRVAEARLVDGMISLSKFTAGRSGRSVARSYLSTLDFMVPIEASVSGAIGNDPSTVTDERLKTVRDRYQKAMDYLKSPDESFTAFGRSKLETHLPRCQIDFNFSIVDISSGVKRIENSNEAFRNLTLMADDGVSEYSSVILTPSHWATIVRDKIINWEQRNNRPTTAEIRAELRRLRNLLASHEVLRKV
ncbi:hypothetical protein PG984_014032 [Apiospora sp. TS-2023a]